MQKMMNDWWEKWDLHVDVCPCDVHFNEWVEAKKIVGRTIYHFGTGTHHVVGLRQAELGNCVLRHHGIEGGVRGLRRARDRECARRKNPISRISATSI